MILLLQQCLAELRIPVVPLQGCWAEPMWAAGFGSEGLHRARHGLRVVAPGGVGIFLGQGIVEMSFIQVAAVGQLAVMHNSAGREKFMEDQTGSILSLGSHLGPWHCPLRALSTTPSS